MTGRFNTRTSTGINLIQVHKRLNKRVSIRSVLPIYYKLVQDPLSSISSSWELLGVERSSIDLRPPDATAIASSRQGGSLKTEAYSITPQSELPLHSDTNAIKHEPAHRAMRVLDFDTLKTIDNKPDHVKRATVAEESSDRRSLSSGKSVEWPYSGLASREWEHRLLESENKRLAQDRAERVEKLQVGPGLNTATSGLGEDIIRPESSLRLHRNLGELKSLFSAYRDDLVTASRPSVQQQNIPSEANTSEPVKEKLESYGSDRTSLDFGRAVKPSGSQVNRLQANPGFGASEQANSSQEMERVTEGGRVRGGDREDLSSRAVSIHSESPPIRVTRGDHMVHSTAVDAGIPDIDALPRLSSAGHEEQSFQISGSLPDGNAALSDPFELILLRMYGTGGV